MSKSELQFRTSVKKNLLQTKNIYIWELYRYIKSRNMYFNGRIKNFSTDLDNGISIENIIDKLSKENIFDFNYIPKEKDRIRIYFNSENKENSKQFSLTFIQGKWSVEKHSVLFNVEEKIAKGEIIIKESHEY